MKEYEKLFTNALESGDVATALAIAQQAFVEEPENENLLAWMCGNICEKQIPGGESLIVQFVDDFPSSLHPMRLYLSGMLLSQNQFDSASNEARIYLHMLKKEGIFHSPEKIAQNALLAEVVGRAFIQLTSVYTEAGARSYSKRALEYGSVFVSDYWKNVYTNEMNNLAQELENKKLRKLDMQWEEFFQSGKNLKQLIKLCQKQKFVTLEKRIGLIEGKFRYDAQYKVDESELFQVIFGENDTFGLF